MIRKPYATEYPYTVLVPHTGAIGWVPGVEHDEDQAGCYVIADEGDAANAMSLTSYSSPDGKKGGTHQGSAVAFLVERIEVASGRLSSSEPGESEDASTDGASDPSPFATWF